MEYKKRIADKILEEKLKIRGACLIQGPKWCGKTTTGKQLANSFLSMSDPIKLKENFLLLDINPRKLLEGETPRLIDEWQVAPELWDLVRFEVDERNKVGQFILTGSSVPCNTDKIFHTGVGRITSLTMRTMSLYESEDSNGSVSLKTLFDSPAFIEGTNSLSFSDLSYLICRGGWPFSLNMEKEFALLQPKAYFDEIVEFDLSRMTDNNLNKLKIRKLLKSYARLQGSSASISKIVDDVGDELPIDRNTVSKYISLLKDIFVIDEVEAWNPNLRSKTAIKSSNVRYFVDPSVASAALGISPKDLENDLNTFGLLFETMCIRDLKVYAEANHGNVYHYLDKNGLECDAVIHLDNGKYGLIEIKLGGDILIEEAIKNLNKLESKIDVLKMNKPSFKMVLVGVGEFAYRNKEGIYVVPIGCLKD